MITVKDAWVSPLLSTQIFAGSPSSTLMLLFMISTVTTKMRDKTQMWLLKYLKCCHQFVWNMQHKVANVILRQRRVQYMSQDLVYFMQKQWQCCKCFIVVINYRYKKAKVLTNFHFVNTLFVWLH